MKCSWIAVSPGLSKGVAVINNLDNIKYEQFLNRIIIKITNHSPEIFTAEEIQKLMKMFDVSEENLQLAVKSLAYIYRRSNKYVLMPNQLNDDLKEIGLTTDKADVFVKLWATETKQLVNNIHLENDCLNISWQLNAELSSNVCKKTKIPKLHLTLSNENAKENEIELNHEDLYSMFLQFEAIQHELDNIL